MSILFKDFHHGLLGERIAWGAKGRPGSNDFASARLLAPTAEPPGHTAHERATACRPDPLTHPEPTSL